MDLRLYDRKKGCTTTLEVQQLGEDHFRLLDNDVFNHQLTLGTEIKAKPVGDGTHELIAVTKASELITRWFVLSPKYTESDYRVLGDELVKHGGFWQVDFSSFLTINIPHDFPYDMDRVMADLNIQLWEDKGDQEAHG
jgi:hypothetical protein